LAGEGCFYVSINADPGYKYKYRVKAAFHIGLHKRGIALLEQIQPFFGIGTISKLGNNIKQYRVTSIKELQIIINHFDKYPLITKKRADYELFKAAVFLINNKDHLTLEGFEKLLSIRSSMNLGLTSVLKTAFPNVIPFPKLDLWDSNIKDPATWVAAGFSSGEGCFFVHIAKSKTSALRAGEIVQLKFNITQHSRDELLIKSLVEYFGCGKVYLYPSP